MDIALHYKYRKVFAEHQHQHLGDRIDRRQSEKLEFIKNDMAHSVRMPMYLMPTGDQMDMVTSTFNFNFHLFFQMLQSQSCHSINCLE